MDFFGTIMAPFKWLVSIIMIGFHDGLSAIGMPAANGWTWTLSIIGLVLVIRAALIPVFVKQIKAQRGMQLLQPDLKKLQDKYKGKTDQLSRQAMAQEQMAMYKKHGTNPFSACLPMLIQMPFFFALFQVLSGITAARQTGAGIGAMSHEQVVQFDESSIFGAPLSASLLHGGGGNQVAVWILSIVMILAMTASQFITQKQIMAKNMSEEAMASPFMRQQKMMLYILPLVFGVGGINFPIGVLIYWTTTNLWTMGQQFFVIRRMPTPGSPAAKALAERRAAKGLPALSVLTGKRDDAVDAAGSSAVEIKGQRVQPQRKNRKKK
ncbi:MULTISPECIES: membrane protein insertase YidC [unclassified Arthrobacter]|jgi:YidC/Oxa1 family membrane protein insertase|uniref:membrane protein insertase YidC n=1 Tax=unclassified Arthrobacter TaxID=235627 RepID=UPI00115255A8|nr:MULTISPECIES: membrane protein insertase YidC [unclassified Arthrobacter]MDQ0827938.1 YidC/Oxa1 family membrane protein insertase [Arthrobacter sp. B2I5]TQJ34543.1 YidC/Oxa1 family membrane protein insertase [Arthrobacter sp. SLBN-122]